MSESLRDWTEGEFRLLLWRCSTCGHSTALPHVGCPSCGGTSVAAMEAGRTARCIARTALHVRASGALPVVLVLAVLDEGVVVMAGADADVSVGDRVRARFAPLGVEEALVPVFSREGDVPSP